MQGLKNDEFSWAELGVCRAALAYIAELGAQVNIHSHFFNDKAVYGSNSVSLLNALNKKKHSSIRHQRNCIDLFSSPNPFP